MLQEWRTEKTRADQMLVQYELASQEAADARVSLRENWKNALGSKTGLTWSFVSGLIVGLSHGQQSGSTSSTGIGGDIRKLIGLASLFRVTNQSFSGNAGSVNPDTMDSI